MASELMEIISAISLAQKTTIEVKSQMTQGFSNHVYELRTGNGERLCLRIPVDKYAGRFALQGAKYLRHVKEKNPTLRVPRVIYSSEQYMVLDFVPGNPLGIWSTSVLALERRYLILDGLATFLLGLWETELSVPKNGHENLYRDWLRKEVDRGLGRALEGTSAWASPHAIQYLQRRMMIGDLVPSPDNGLVAIRHGDLNAWNVIVTEHGLSGVIDWDTSQIVPAPAAVQHPLFIADIPGWRNYGVSQAMTFKYDRTYLEHAIRQIEGGDGPIASLLESSRERQFFEMSLHNSRINAEYIEQRLQCEISRVAALEELEDFLSAHDTMRSLPNVLHLRAQLTGE